MAWLKTTVKDRLLTVVLLTIFGVLSSVTVVSARSAQKASERAQTLIERSNVNSPLISLIKDCTTPGGTCYNRNAQVTSGAIQTVVAQEACVIKESLGFSNLPDRTPAEATELKNLCRNLLGGDALDLIRRVAPKPGG